MKKNIEENVTYVKDDQVVLVDSSNLFVYESCTYLHHKNYFSLCNKKYFSSPKQIEGVVSSFWKNSHTQICSELFSAPEQWLIENNFIRYIKTKPDKKVKIKKVENNDK